MKTLSRVRNFVGAWFNNTIVRRVRRLRFAWDVRWFSFHSRRQNYTKASKKFDRILDWMLSGRPSSKPIHRYPENKPDYEGAPILIEKKETWDRLVAEGRIRSSPLEQLAAKARGDRAKGWLE